MIRKATLNDIPRISEINVFSWRSSFRGIVSDEFLFGKLLVVRNMRGYEKFLQENTYEMYVYEEDAIIKAFSSFSKCTDEDKENAFELNSIYVDPLMKRSGIGTQLVQHCEKEAIKRGFRENVLWVFKENISARTFYEKLGYLCEQQREKIDSLKAIEIRYCKRLT